ncbi:MAG: hypothetical protein WEB67_08845, partial [Acidimicrobiia bacterium]
MSRISDYRNRMTLTQFAEDEIEILLSSGEAADPELADLASFVNALRDQSIFEPSAAEVDRLARGAAAVARSKAATIRPGSPSRSRRPPKLSLRAISSVAMAMFVMVAVSSLGLVANAAVPGDALYGLDLAMEKVGIGAGSLHERVSEAHVLAERGDHDQAVAHLTASISEAGDTAMGGDFAAAVKALAEYIEIVEVNGPQSPGTPEIGNPTNENTGPGNNNAGGNSETNENTGPGNNNAGGNSET